MSQISKTVPPDRFWCFLLRHLPRFLIQGDLLFIKENIVSVREDAEKLEPSHILGGGVK